MPSWSGSAGLRVAFYPVIRLDAIRVKVRADHRVSNRSAHIAVGVDMDGVKHVLGIWIQDGEGASFWAHVCADLANRGVQDVLIVCCDGPAGLPEAARGGPGPTPWSPPAWST